jgi:hypothetical protein
VTDSWRLVSVLNTETRFLNIIAVFQLNSGNEKPGFLRYRGEGPFLVQLFFLVSYDRTVRLRIGDAGEDISGLHLVVVQERLVGLVNFAFCDFAGAGGASTSAARVGEVDSLFFSRIKNVLILWNLNGRVKSFGFVDEGNFVSCHALNPLKNSTILITFPNATFKALLALRLALRFVPSMIVGERSKVATLIYKKFEWD